MKRSKMTAPFGLHSAHSASPEPTEHPLPSPSMPSLAMKRKGTMTSSPSFIMRTDHRIQMAAEEGYESAQVFVGTLRELREARFCMVRLKEGVQMPELLDQIPIRFLFVILGPTLADVNYHEIGRSVATLMSNPHFHNIAYTAPNAAQIDSAIDDFLDGSIVIPPGEIDSKQLLSVEDINKALRSRNKRRDEAREKINERGMNPGGLVKTDPPPNQKPTHRGDPLKRRGLFRGLVDDIRWRLPWYWSDFRDALNFQCFTSVIFMFFAAFAPAITFGGLLGKETEDAMGIKETLMSQCLCGLIWGFFTAQPLNVISITGPVLIFETSLYMFCEDLHLNFLTVRIWTGVWVAFLALITVAFEGSFLISYVTDFSEDIFSILISIIFIKETVKFLMKTLEKNPVGELSFYMERKLGCMEKAGRGSWWRGENGSLARDALSCYGPEDDSTCCEKYQPDSFLLTLILLLSTFIIIIAAKRVRNSPFFGRTIRRGFGDFAIFFAILIIAIFDYFVFPKSYVEKLHIESGLSFTNPMARNSNGSGSGMVDILLPEEQWWGYFFALIPAILVYILLFVETEITELLLAKKERGLEKGTGYHWDLLLIGLLCLLCGFLGLPWMCPAAAESLGHVSSLTVRKRHAPGERATVDHVIEQRVTILIPAILLGSCIFIGNALGHVPMAAVYGVFLYLGVMSLPHVPLMKRIVLLFIPEKYFPDTPYCSKVGMWRMHGWTGLQVISLIFVFLVKYYKETSFAFPFALMIVALIRLFVLPKVYTHDEIQALDGHEEEEEDEEVFPYCVF